MRGIENRTPKLMPATTFSPQVLRKSAAERLRASRGDRSSKARTGTTKKHASVQSMPISPMAMRPRKPARSSRQLRMTPMVVFDEIVNVHFKGVYFLTQKLLPLINDGGRIVNISSGFARFAIPGSSAYGAAKGAVEVLARYLAKEFGPRGITVNVVAPGAIQTDFSGGMVRDNPEVNKMGRNMTALGRAGVPDDS